MPRSSSAFLLSFRIVFFRVMSFRAFSLRKGIPVLFLPAGIGLLFEIAFVPTAAQKILAIALAIFCPELARMAWVDLRNIEALTSSETPASEVSATAAAETGSKTVTIQKTVAIQPEERNPTAEIAWQTQQLDRFHFVIISTIALETTGFYLSLASLSVGAIVIIASQVWFNLLANIQLYPDRSIPIVSCGLKDRKAILLVTAITTGLLCLWPIPSMRLGLSVALLGLVTAYLAVKYVFFESI